MGPKPTIHGRRQPARKYWHIFAIYICHIYLPPFRLTAATNQRENILPFSRSFLFSNCKILLCHHSFLLLPRLLPCANPPMLCHFPSLSNCPLFHIIFTDSLYVSLYIIFTMKK